MELADLIDRHVPELDIGIQHFGGEARLRQVILVGVDTHHAVCAPALHLDGVKAGIAADVENGLSAEVLRNGVGEFLPFHAGIVAEEVIRRGLHAAEVEIVEPLSQLLDLALQGLAIVPGRVRRTSARDSLSCWLDRHSGASRRAELLSSDV